MMVSRKKNLEFSPYVDELVQNSECFDFDAYNVGLRRYVKERSRNGNLGQVYDVKVDPNVQEIDPICLLLGENNRMFKRYPLICNLLDGNYRKNLKHSAYYQNLWRFYSTKNIIRRVKGRKEIKRKINRIFEIDKYIKKKRTLKGIHSYLQGQSETESRFDYPINLICDITNGKDKVIQLDGSHRRSIFCYNGILNVTSINVKLTDVIANINKRNEPYMCEHVEKFLYVIKSVND